MAESPENKADLGLSNIGSADYSPKKMLFGLNDKPPLPATLLAAFQHFLAIFVSIITAPLIISVGMGLSVKDTSYIISASLFVSGVATLIQVIRFGPLGAKMLCIQGTSFSFIGPLIFAAESLKGTLSQEEILGVIFGSAAVGGLTMMVVSQFLHKLNRIITPTVTGVAVVLLGVSLVLKTLENLMREYNHISEAGESLFSFFLLSGGVVIVILLLTRSVNPWIRLSAISIGIVLGYIYALFFGLIDFAPLGELPMVFAPEVLRFPLGFDWGVYLALLPIYLVTLAESVGDLTATSILSGKSVTGESYWARVKRGVLADGFNSFLASMFSSYPNTTFSQNNGVIQLTGVASRYVGIFVAGFLIIFGMLPVIGGIFQVMPKALLYGATGLMFAMISVSGYRILSVNRSESRTWIIAGIAVVIALAVSFFSTTIDTLNPQLKMLLGFPVAVGTLVAIILEMIYPKTDSQ